MKLLPRYTIKAAGESGQGVNSVGEILAKALKESGLYTFGYREYPSLIKGGYACHQIDISDEPLVSPSAECDFLVCMSRMSFHAYIGSVRTGGRVLHSLRQLELTAVEQEWVKDRQISIAYIPAEMMALEAGGKAVMANTILIGVLWQLLGIELAPVEAIIRKEFAKKPQVIEVNLKCLQAGYQHTVPEITSVKLPFKFAPERERDAVISGNYAMALGAVAAGVRAYYAYPMTPSSSILTYLASMYQQTGMVVKQVEDEISVAQMAIGSMFMGTRALVGTSGGGFDLMTESLSMAAMTETPFVCILGQRPGPATGLPTWTATGDLNLAIYAGHGEYARCVLAASDPSTAYILVQKAFNIAEKFQTPVIVLTEKQIAESLFQIQDLPADVPIERHLVPAAQLQELQKTDRYKDTANGVSPRWLPGQSDATFDGNSDEHLADGSLTEAAAPVKVIYDKRLRKHASILAELPEPELMGPEAAKTTLLGWGSVKNTVVDVMKIWNQAHPEAPVNYLHYEYMYPLRTDVIKRLLAQGNQIIPVENNAFAQLARLVTQETGHLFDKTWLRYDGRPFFVEDIIQSLETEFGVQTVEKYARL